MEELNSEIEGLNRKVETFLSRVEGLYSLVEELHRRFNSTIKMLTLVLRLVRKFSNPFHMKHSFS